MPLLRYLGLLTELGIEPLQIAPSHGIIWKQGLPKIVEAYRSWASGEVEEKVIIICDTMWGSTEIMANEIAETIRAAGVEVKLLNLRKNPRSCIMKEMFDAAAFAVGSPTSTMGYFQLSATSWYTLKVCALRIKKLWHLDPTAGEVEQ
jgi:flavorubredoxin